MTHWQTEKNRTHMKKHMRKNVMTKKQIKEFFGHSWEKQKDFKTIIVFQTESFTYNAYSNKNGQLCDIVPIICSTDTDEIKELKNKNSSLFLSKYREVPLDLLFK